ncbi:NtaA/DmoA family FMN-dependent monooxygenase [Rhodococcus sp. NPDC057529]|uniref:NtaA/DmoA family FMN-dependent monooxygenase n=1 Tax=Rhodococcus sp. NPDC057529 TaxID=3346158 RepID=UPI0036703853
MNNLIWGVFESFAGGNGIPSWRHPKGRGDVYLQLPFWKELAQLLESADFDFLFFADSFAAPEVDGAVPDTAFEEGVQIGCGDTHTLLSALAGATEKLGLVTTSSALFETPIVAARRFSTLDHLSNGRVGWNVVSASGAHSAARIFGVPIPPHDGRYDIADEFVDLQLALWEGSWADDAYKVDRGSVFTDPRRVRRIEHDGKYFNLNGYFPVPPSPQRTPVLFQAGTSPRGREFAGRTAECVLLQPGSVEAAAKAVTDIRQAAVAAGRRETDVKLISGITVTVAPTHDEAVEKRRQLEDAYLPEAAAIVYAIITGINLLDYDQDKPLPQVSADGGTTHVDRFKDQKPPTAGEILDSFRKQGLRGYQVTGDPIEVADRIEQIAKDTGLDGFMLEPTFGNLDSYRDFIDLVVPELAKRGLWGAREGDTLRQRIFGAESNGRLPDNHPGAKHRIRPTPAT